MNKKIFLMAVMLVFIVGCGMQTTKEPLKDTDIHKGTDGLTIDFLENMPPEEILAESPFQVGLELRNKGASDITQGSITIGKLDKEYFEILDENTKDFTLEGKSLSSPKGGYEVITFSLENKKAPKEEKEFFFTILSCYDYKTIASAEVCLNPVSAEGAMIGSEVCEVEDVVLGSQGAPVAVSQIKEYILPDKESNKNKVIFNVYIDNVGGGAVTKKEHYIDVCDDLAPKPTKFDEVEIKISATIGGEYLDCKEIKQEKENQNQIVFSCSALIDIEESHITLISIELEYGYITEEFGRKIKVTKLQQEIPCENCIEDSTWGVCKPVYGEEIVEATPNCPDGYKCCTESKSLCEKLKEETKKDYECLNVDEEECAVGTIEPGKCTGSENIRCCIRKSEEDCEHCVDTEEWNSCEAFGGDATGTCQENLRCCAQSEPECKTDSDLGNNTNYNDGVGSYWCVLESEIGTKYNCTSITDRKCPGAGVSNKKCCLIKEKP